MSALTPLETLYEAQRGDDVLLPSALARLYGRLTFSNHPGRPYVISNFVATLDGVVALDTSGHQGGGEISGSNLHDRVVMGLLRAVADAVVVGAGTLRASPRHIWTAEHIYSPLGDEYRTVRQRLKLTESPLNVVVTASGDVDMSLPVFQSERVSVLIVTTKAGASRLSERRLPPSTRLAAATKNSRLSARAIVDAIVKEKGSHPLVLVEGGSLLMGDFYAEHCLDEQFLTLAPQVAGRDDSARRPGLVDGRILAPKAPVWGALIGVKRSGDHLFLRYAFEKSPTIED